MSLLRPIVRACAVAALRDQTWAGAQVYDSDMTPFADAVYGQAAAPYVVIYTDADDRMPKGAELYDGSARSLSLVVEIGIASSIKNDAGLVVQFAATDEGMEFAVDVLEAQVIASLWGDPASEWGELLRSILYRVRKMPSRRGGQAQKGIRFAARRTSFMCDSIDDLPPGVVPNPEGPIARFIAMAAAHPDVGISDCGTIIQSLLAGGAGPTWRQAQAYMGMSTRAIRALNPDGTPLPWPNVEKPPFDWSDHDEFVPPMTSIATPLSMPAQPLTPAPLAVAAPALGTP
jgi:hypothetical protein